MDISTLERNARTAKHMSSFSDYKEGTATDEYNSYCARAEEVATKAKERLERAGAPAERAEKVDYLLGVYRQKKLEWLTSLYANRASCPSVMISGPANYPVRKQERMIAREKSLYENDPEYLVDKIREMGHNAGTIYSDDENAVERIKEKINNCGDATEIRRLKERLLQLAPEEFAEQQANISINGAKTYAEIVALWGSGKISKSGDRWYFDLTPLVFTDGKRKCQEWLNFEVDESGQNRLQFNLKTRVTDSIPLTDAHKYALIIGRISGSGNKSVIYQHLKNLSPVVQEKKAEAAEAEQNGQTVTINGEEAKVKRDREDMRLRLIFDGKPEDGTRDILKGNGFRWAPSEGAWQRLLNDNAESALRRITDKEVSA